jgi:hypothetical protein
MNRARFLVPTLITLLFASGCATFQDSGTMGSLGSYMSQDAGHHWVRPMEVTYQIGEIVEATVTIDSASPLSGETILLGYPQPGRAASPHVAFAAAKLVADAKADGIFITSYIIDRPMPDGKVLVHLQGRLLKLTVLGQVDLDRADKERFTTVVEQDPETGLTRTYTMPSAAIGKQANSPSTSTVLTWFKSQ